MAGREDRSRLEDSGAAVPSEAIFGVGGFFVREDPTSLKLRGAQ